MHSDALATALRHHRAGELQQAERIYRQILDADPNSSDALYYLAQLASQTGNLPAATQLMGRAIAIDPENAIYHCSLGNLLIRQRKFDQAVTCYQHAVRINPEYCEAHSNLGNALIAQGKLDQAVVTYQRVLQLNPQDAGTYTNLGNVLQELGKFDHAMASYQRALQLDPHNARGHYNLGNALQAQGQLDQAVACYLRALQFKPDYAEAHDNLGSVLKRQSKLDEAIASYRRALQLKPAYAEAHYNLGCVLKEQGQLDQAVAAFQEALRIQPQFEQAHNNLGNALKDQGKPDRAVAAYRRALQINPRNAQAHYNLGNLLQLQGQLDAAVTAYQRAVEIKPRYASAHSNLGSALQQQGRLDQAVACYQRALQIDPRNFDTHNSLGSAFVAQGEFGRAVAAYERALQIKPESCESHYNLGVALSGQGQLEEAIASYERALQLDPGFMPALSGLVHQLQQVCGWRDLADFSRRIIESVDVDADAVYPPFYFLALPATAAQQLRCAQRWAKYRFRKLIAAAADTGFRFSPGDRKRIRVGYLSAKFNQHAGGTLIPEVIEQHDRQRFEIVGYSCGPDDGGPLRQRLIKALDRFEDVRADSFLAAAQRIHADGIDILVDLTGLEYHARTEILALRPAPIQVNYLGYPGTIGAPFMDYIVVDQFVAPPDQQEFFSERLVHLPGCYQANDSQREISSETPSRTGCGLPETGFVFCSFNNNYKITPAVFEIWMRLLRAVPGGALWLLEGNRYAPDNLRREARQRGVAEERLVFAPRAVRADHLARHRLAGLFLDSYPCNAHVTASDALWAGLPVVTLAGKTFASRVAGSLLHALGLPELVTSSLAEYERLALDLARDPQRLNEIRRRLTASRDTCGLFDGGGLARNLEQAYSQMWKIFAAGEPPRPISVTQI